MKKVCFVLASFAVCSSAQAVELETKDGTTFSLGGYVKAESIYNMPEAGKNSFSSTARQSRVNIKTSKMINDQKVTGFVEGDFYGSDSSPKKAKETLRLRHAYMQAGNYTLGKTWNGQFLSVIPLLNESIDFTRPAHGTMGGSGGNARPDMVLHYANNGLRLTAQDPVYADADIPDLLASYSGKAANLSYNAAVTAREVTDSNFGVGVSLTGKMALNGVSSLHASVYTGEGMGVYSGVGSDVEGGKLVSQTGYQVGYRHQLTPQLRTNLRYSEVNVDNTADYSSERISANLLYKYSPEIDFGIEWRDEDNKNNVGTVSSLSGQKIEVMAKYAF